MKKYFSILTIHTFLVLSIGLISSFVCYQFHLTFDIDFVVFGIVIAFPIAFSLKAAFRRREVAIRYLCLFKSSLQAVIYVIGDSKIDELKKSEFKNIATYISNELIEYLTRNKHDAGKVQNASHLIYTFVRSNREYIKGRTSLKIFLFTFRINKSIEFLLATRRHNIPWGPKEIVLAAIYIFIIVYPASYLYDKDASLSFLFATTAFKGFFLISFYNILSMIEDPFNQKSPDGIRVNDFHPFDSSTENDISKVQPT